MRDFATFLAEGLTLSKVNKALEAAGAEERLYQGKGYLYFADGDAHRWSESMVGGIATLNSLTLDQWIATWKEMKEAGEK